MGAIMHQIAAIIGGVITILVGLALSDPVLNAVSGAATFEEVDEKSVPPDEISCTNPDGSAIANDSRETRITAIGNDDGGGKSIICDVEGFSGAGVVLFLMPIVYFLVIIAIGLGMVGMGALGIAGRGALAQQR